MTTMPGSWAMRRRVIFAALGFCALVVAWVLVTGLDTEAAQTAVAAAFHVAGAIIGAYVFGAVWDDWNARKQQGGPHGHPAPGPADRQ